MVMVAEPVRLSLAQRAARLYFTRFPVERGKWRLWRQVRGRLGAPPPPGVWTTPSGLRLHLDTRDFIDEFILYWGQWEPNETALVRALLRPGDGFLDVGANIGWFTLTAAQVVGPEGRVIAVEATPPTFDRLRGNIALNSLSNITLHGCAVSDVPGEVWIGQLHGANRGMNSMRAAKAEAGGEGWSVPAVTLDGLLADAGPIHLVKMDIEGAEALALRGFRQRLSAPDAPDVLVELTPAYLGELGTGPEEILSLFAETGHTALRLRGRKVSPLDPGVIDGALGFSAENILFTRDEARVLRRLSQ